MLFFFFSLAACTSNCGKEIDYLTNFSSKIRSEERKPDPVRRTGETPISNLQKKCFCVFVHVKIKQALELSVRKKNSGKETIVRNRNSMLLATSQLLQNPIIYSFSCLSFLCRRKTPKMSFFSVIFFFLSFDFLNLPQNSFIY